MLFKVLVQIPKTDRTGLIVRGYKKTWVRVKADNVLQAGEIACKKTGAMCTLRVHETFKEIQIRDMTHCDFEVVSETFF